MRNITRFEIIRCVGVVTLLSLLSLFTFDSIAEESYAKILSAYIAENGKCQKSEFPPNSQNYTDDFLLNGVCFPKTSLFRGDYIEYSGYAVVELTKPHLLEKYIESGKQAKALVNKINARKEFEAYTVYVDNYTDLTLTLLDGTRGFAHLIIEPSKYDEAVLIRDSTKWLICVQGTTYEYNIVQQSPFTRSSIDVESVDSLESHPQCGYF